MKEDNECYSETKESLKKTVQVLRDTVSQMYYIAVLVYLNVTVKKYSKVHFCEMKKKYLLTKQKLTVHVSTNTIWLNMFGKCSSL